MCLIRVGLQEQEWAPLIEPMSSGLPENYSQMGLIRDGTKRCRTVAMQRCVSLVANSIIIEFNGANDHTYLMIYLGNAPLD